MVKQAAKALAPGLRFPEFRDAPGFSPRPLSHAFLRITNGKANAQDHVEGGTYPLFDRSEVVKASNEFLFSSEAVILPGEGMAFRPRHFDGNFNLHQRAYALMECQGHAKFFFYALDYAKDDLALKAVKSTVLSLRLPIIEKFVLYAPGKAEQKRIADCLTSLDEVIAAQGRKVEALKAHKRGLMQQLFPREGETRPRLRFPEFRDAPEWAEKTLGETASVQMCKRIFASETNTIGGVPFYKIGTLGGVPDAYISKELFNDYRSKYNFPRVGEILITCSGTVGKCLRYDGRDSYFQDSNIVWIDNPTGTISNDFLFELISNVDWGKLNSTTITRIYGPDLRGLSIKYPKDAAEQQRIADCLSSLDTQITAESNRLAALKTHKQGLMQQLFPAPEAAQV